MTYPIRNNIGSFPTWLWRDEAEIINALITACLKRGFMISVFDGEEWAVKKSTKRAEIQKEVAATDETTFRVRDAEGEYVGFFWLIHGNRAHVVSDHTANEICEAIWEEIEPVIDHWEAQA
ncbi:hypothetical protein MHM88_14615 [Epibacterium sp. MM17-32]|uniref:hypothetical protein n=1 Tax=Epibacterium sp. MM17-32 TaxID=2917734 RepID=UPI001EF4DAF9|nr:hypothetical protein [Epibacterium sp. MM17-32]MCG7629041.1 hypothetical protein [Epibacterium sp. MM17-32]